MVDFAGWRLPVQYGGVLDEHMAVRTQAGMFDVSHMGEAHVAGRQALEYLQHVTSNDVSRLAAGRAHYTALTTERGTFVDDLLIYRLDEREFLLVLNAANTAKDVAWLMTHRAGFDVEVRDDSERWAQIAVQGPRSAAIVERALGLALDTMRYYGFVWHRVGGARAIVSRTGYTGEDGFEVYVAPAEAPGLWRALLGAGAQEGLVPAGLAARDTLRLEAKMALYGNDIDDTTTVLEADLGWIVKLDKGPFIGREPLAAQARDGLSRKLAGFEMRGRAIPRQGYAVMHNGATIGRVTSGTWAPFLRRGIGLAYLPVAHTAIGTEIEIEVRGRGEPATVVATPFYKRAR
jgi:aminomethyltransferase